MLKQLEFLASKEQFRNAPFKTVTRLGAWKLHCLLSKGATIGLEDTPLRMSLPPLWHGHPKLLYTFGWRFDPELPFLARTVSKGAVVLDIGANVGTWSLILSEAVGADGKIFSFEPTQSTFDTLAKNVNLNSRKNIFPFRYALSNSNDQIRIYHDADASRNSIGQTRTDNGAADYEEVPGRTLDSLFSELSIDKLDFIKIDVEGAEPLVFEGAAGTITRFKPTILLEINPNALAALGFKYDSSWQILSGLDYRFYDLQPDNSLKEVFECPTELANLWAIHRSSKFFPGAKNVH